MAKAVILDTRVTEELVDQRHKLGIDRWDEAWDGVWHMNPSPSREHQRIEAELLIILKEVVERGGLGEVLHEFNVADPEKGLQDFRIPDLSVVLHDSRAQVRENFIAGGPDFIIEIHSPGDETYDKLAWYANQGVREVLVIDRDTRALAFYRRQGSQLVEAGSSPASGESEVLPLRFERVLQADPSRLRLSHQRDPGRRWEI
jgi:Uma2 family endonuclease